MKVRKLRHARYTHKTPAMYRREMFRLVDRIASSLTLHLSSFAKPLPSNEGDTYSVVIRKPARYVV